MISDRITLQLYDANDEPSKLLSRTGIRWATLKRLLDFQHNIERCENDAERLMLTMDMVASIFEGQATREEIEAGARFDDCIETFRQIMKLVRTQKNANFQPGR